MKTKEQNPPYAKRFIAVIFHFSNSNPLESFFCIFLAPIDGDTLFVFLVQNIASLCQPIQQIVISAFAFFANHSDHLT